MILLICYYLACFCDIMCKAMGNEGKPRRKGVKKKELFILLSSIMPERFSSFRGGNMDTLPTAENGK